MIFRFLLLSDEVDDFKREIRIDADSTFAHLQTAILQSVGYKEGEIASFFICTDSWEKEMEITAMEMDTDSDVDSYVMVDTVLGDILEDEKQKLMYVFDFMTERAFYMELREIIPGQSLDDAVCTLSKGNPPVQFIDFDEVEAKNVSLDVGETFYGDEDYSLDELDADGFDGLDSMPDSGSEDYY